MSRKKIGKAEKNEIDILKKLSHVHIIKLVGTYTHHRTLGILLHPVAVCDLHTFFEDIETYNQGLTLEDEQSRRLTALGYSLEPGRSPLALGVYSQIGCLVSAIAYLHGKEIRHKDLKPSNILLVPDGLYLSDFGSATDFSLLSSSATNSERGTPRYFAPEVATWKPNSRPADMFSLGCLLLEILLLHTSGSLDTLRQLRTSRDTSFHGNLDKIAAWLSSWLTPPNNSRPVRAHLIWEIQCMLSFEPTIRPTAPQLLDRMQSCHDWSSEPSMFGACCRKHHVPNAEVDHIVDTLEGKIQKLIEEKEKLEHALLQSESRVHEAQKELEVMQSQQLQSQTSQAQPIQVPQAEHRVLEMEKAPSPTPQSARARRKARSREKAKTNASAIQGVGTRHESAKEVSSMTEQESSHQKQPQTEHRTAPTRSILTVEPPTLTADEKKAAFVKQFKERLRKEEEETEKKFKELERQRIEEAEFERKIAELEEAELRRDREEQRYAEARKVEVEKVVTANDE